MKKRISRNDVIFLAILLAVVTVFLVVYERTGTRADAGACVRVTVDGSVYGTYALGEEQEIPIVQDGVTTNVLTIRDGRADMTEADCPEGYIPRMVSTGLADIMMPVRDHETLMRAVQNAPVVTELSRKYDVTGVHMFCTGRDGVTAWCSNYAPLYDIPEECATGTSNGALTYYLYLRGDVKPERENVFLQGEHMGRPSEIRSLLYEKDGTVTVRIGGSAVMSLDCELKL